MVRFENTGNTQFVRYLGDYRLKQKFKDWQGDSTKRMPGGKQILSPRARLLHRANRKRFDPEAESKVTEPGIHKININNPAVAKIKKPIAGGPYPGSKPRY